MRERTRRGDGERNEGEDEQDGMMSAEKGIRWGRRSAASHLKLVKTYVHITSYIYIDACVCENGPDYE